MTIDKSLLEAYNSTTYKVFNTDIEIRIGQNSTQLDKLLTTHNCNTWAFITPYNPYSRMLMTESHNYPRLIELKKDLIDYKILEGEGLGTDPSWVPERSFLILGIDKTKAELLGKKYEQNAIVVGMKGGKAELSFV